MPGAWQIQPLNIGAIFSMATQMKQLEQRKEELAYARGVQEKERAFAEKAELLKLRHDFAKEQREQAGAARDAEKHLADTTGPVALMAARAARVLRNNPELYPNVAREINASGYFPEQQLPVEMAPDQVALFADQLETMAPTMARAPEDKPVTPIQAARQTAELLGYGDDVAAARTDERYGPMVKRLLIDDPNRRASAVGGRSDLGTTATNKLQDQIIASERNIDSINAIDGMLSKDLFDWKAKAKGAAGPALEVVGMAPDELLNFNKRRQRFQTEAGLFVAKWIKNISGASVNESERKALEAAIGSPENMTYSQWQQVIETMRTIEGREQSMAKRMLRNKGIDVSVDKPRGAATGSSVKVGDIRVHPEHGRVRLRADGKWETVD